MANTDTQIYIRHVFAPYARMSLIPLRGQPKRRRRARLYRPLCRRTPKNGRQALAIYRY